MSCERAPTVLYRAVGGAVAGVTNRDLVKSNMNMNTLLCVEVGFKRHAVFG